MDLPAVPLPATHATLLLPPPALSGCLMAAISRSTQGVALRPEQRINRFPASPLCGLTWVLQGEVRGLPWSTCWRQGQLDDGETMAAVNLGGPHAGPSLSSSPGPMHGFMLLLFADALQALTGIDPGQWQDRVVPAAPLFNAEWRAWFREVAAAADDTERMRRVNDFLAPRWADARPRGNALLRSYRDWTQALALRAATSGLGRSARQMERRIKTWSGQSLRQLNGLARAEASFLIAREAERSGTPLDWAQIADASGYADQSHFCREVKRVTGYAPAEFNARLNHDESFWIYRLWGA